MSSEFWIGDVIIPIVTFVIGILTGEKIERNKAKAKIKGDNNTVIQNSDIRKQ